MSGDAHLEPKEFARAFQRFLDWLPEAAERGEGFARRLADHLGEDPASLPATRLELAEHDRPNLQVALDAYLAQPDRVAELVGSPRRCLTSSCRCRSSWRAAARDGASMWGPSGARWSSSTRGARWRA